MKSSLPVQKHIPTSAHAVALWGHHTLPVAPQPLHRFRTTSFRTHCAIGKTCNAYLSGRMHGAADPAARLHADVIGHFVEVYHANILTRDE
eukprot:4262175-Amphidinium_carterae.1